MFKRGGWLVIAAILFTGIFALGYPRLKTERDPAGEADMDQAVSQAYDHTNSWLPFVLLRHLILSEMKRYQPRGVLLDIGCGPGHLSQEILRKFDAVQVIGLDIKQEMLELARRRLPDKIELVRGDAEHLPLKTAAIDCAVSTLSLHHWNDVTKALQEIHRVLKPGGRLLLLDLRRDCRRWFYYLIKFSQGFLVPTAIRKGNGALGSLFASYTPTEIKALLEISPFKGGTIKTGPGWMFVSAQKTRLTL